MSLFAKTGKVVCLVILLMGMMLPGSAGSVETFPRAEYAYHPKYSIAEYDTETLYYRLGKFGHGGVTCYLAEIWMADPGKQIGKISAPWKEKLGKPLKMTESVPEAALTINGSGYVSPVYPWIPENYPGTNEDYYYTPLGSLTITDGKVYRDLEGVLFNGLTLQEDGLHMWVNANNEDVLAGNPVQTWSFYDECPLILDHEDILPENWNFADRKAMRTVIARVDRNNYLVLMVSNSGLSGLTLREVNQWLLEHYDRIEWAYDLDGGPSSGMFFRRQGKKQFHRVWGGYAMIMDMMYFTE